ncbi:MAG: magnesium transporter CorA [Magnetospirillum sp.]|nr:magnesium transporter CorA [Magnetospirillum sp.]
MPQQTIVDLLHKQKIVESMVRNQAMPRRELVETVVHQQHLAELQVLLARLPVAEIGRILDSLPVDDARLLWALVDEERIDDILWELGDARRTELVGERQPRCRQGQITAYELINGRMRVLTIATPKDLEGVRPVWIDLLDASRPERSWFGRHFGLELPDPDELTDLEVSARFYVEENDEVHLHSNFLLDREGESRSVPVAFIVHADILFTVRNEELPVFRLQRLRARNQPGSVVDCKDLLIDLYAADVEYSADALEDTYATLRAVSQEVLSERVSDTDAARILSEIAEEEDLNGRIRGNMLDTQRAVSFLIRGKFLSQPQADEAREMLRDIESLYSHTAFLFEKINFLLDATVGFININQNRRVSQLTVVSVVFMPINVLAGIGGMSEFSMMTAAIPWPLAYGAFIAGMTLVGWATYVSLKSFEIRRTRRGLATRKPIARERTARSAG